MSIVNWEEEKWFRCPHCKKPLRLVTQDSEGYGTNSWIFAPDDSEFLEEIPEKEVRKLKKKYGWLD